MKTALSKRALLELSSLKRGSAQQLFGGTTKSRGCVMAAKPKRNDLRI